MDFMEVMEQDLYNGLVLLIIHLILLAFPEEHYGIQFQQVQSMRFL